MAQAPAAASLALALLYSLGAHGIMTLNDFKAIEGDRQMGIGSLPVRLGVQGAARAACIFMLLPQVVVIGLLLAWGQPWHALGIVALLVGQALMMRRFLVRPGAPRALVQRLRRAAVCQRHDGQRLCAARHGDGSGMNTDTASLGWLGIARLGLVQAMLGAVVVLTTSTLNRVMVVELALPALLPGLLVALHYAVQLSRPRMGYGSDVGGRRTPWIMGGMAVLAWAASAPPWPPPGWPADRSLGIAARRSSASCWWAWASAPAAPRCWCCWPSAWTPRGAPLRPRWCG